MELGIHSNQIQAHKVPDCMDDEKSTCVLPEIDPTAKDLTHKEFKNAKKGQLDNSFLKLKYRKVARTGIIPAMANQTFFAFSFIPSKEAKPDKDGIYGVARFIGTFPDVNRANDRCEYIIAKYDSYNCYHIGETGVNFPITHHLGYSREINDLNEVKSVFDENDAPKIVEKCTQIDKDYVKFKRDEEKKMKEEAENRKKEAENEIKNPLPPDDFLCYMDSVLIRGSTLAEMAAFEDARKKKIEVLENERIKIEKMLHDHPEYYEKSINDYLQKCKENDVPKEQSEHIINTYFKIYKHLIDDIPEEKC